MQYNLLNETSCGVFLFFNVLDDNERCGRLGAAHREERPPAPCNGPCARGASANVILLQHYDRSTTRLLHLFGYCRAADGMSTIPFFTATISDAPDNLIAPWGLAAGPVVDAILGDLGAAFPCLDQLGTRIL